MNTVGLSLPKHPSLLHFCSHADPQRRSSDYHYRSPLCCFLFSTKKKRNSFFFQNKCNRKPSRVSGHKGIWMSQRRLLAQRSDVTLETPETWLSSPEAEDGAVSAWCCSPTRRQACIEFPRNCSVIAAVTEQRHRGALSPASSLKRSRAFSASSPSTNHQP